MYKRSITSKLVHRDPIKDISSSHTYSKLLKYIRLSLKQTITLLWVSFIKSFIRAIRPLLAEGVYCQLLLRMAMFVVVYNIFYLTRFQFSILQCQCLLCLRKHIPLHSPSLRGTATTLLLNCLCAPQGYKGFFCFAISVQDLLMFFLLLLLFCIPVQNYSLKIHLYFELCATLNISDGLVEGAGVMVMFH